MFELFPLFAAEAVEDAVPPTAVLLFEFEEFPEFFTVELDRLFEFEFDLLVEFAVELLEDVELLFEDWVCD